VAEHEYERILVVDLLGGLGYLIMILPAVHALAHSSPDATMTVLTHLPGGSLLLTDPLVTTVSTCDRNDEYRAVANQLRQVDPDLVVSSTRYGGIPDLITDHRCRAVVDLWRRPPPDMLIADRYLEILRGEGLIGSAEPQASVRMTDSELDHGRRVITGPSVVLVPATGMAVKRWPRRNWEELATRLTLRGNAVFTVNEADRRPLPGARDLPPMSLRELAACFSAVGTGGGVVVGADTGPVRLASALGARTVSLFGPTSAGRYGSGRSQAVNLQGLPGCPHRRPLAITEQPCWWTAGCPLSADGPACMADLTVDAVLAAVIEG
jgi:ADP-heptose:LPS heptosyltransferase